jgi:aspartyl-tRNA(Asn)/glutamyl-tRNA(Gln) amidotransferase subunit C
MLLEDVKKLADLARIDMSDEEIKGIAKDFDAILTYVGQVQEVSTSVRQGLDEIELESKSPDNYFLNNVMREDISTNNRGEYKDKILAEMPNTEDGYLKVKQIL